MRIQKKKLTAWLRDFVAIVSEVSNEDLRQEINLGKALVLCPKDIFDVLKSRRVVEKVGEKFVFSYLGEYGETVVEIRANKDEPGLILTVKGL